jgi:PEGA domain
MVAASWMKVALSCAIMHGAPQGEATESSQPDPSGAPATTAGDVALDPVRFSGTRDERVALAFEEGLRAHVGAAIELAPACASPPCPTHGTTISVVLEERERDYAMTIALRDASGRAGASRTVSCEVCTPDEAAARAGETAIELLRGPDGQARLQVISRPSGAEIWLDGERVGTTPGELTTTAGLHTVELRKPGHHARARELELVAGSRGSLRIELPAARNPQARAMRIAGWTLVGVGAAMFIGGIALVAIDEHPIRSECDGRHVDRFGNCEFRWNTLAGGATLLVGGLAAAGTGTALVVIGNARRRAELRGGPTHASITVRF